MTSAAIDNTLVLDAAAYALSDTSSLGIKVGDSGRSVRPGATGKASFLELLHTLLVYDHVELGYGRSGLYMFRSPMGDFLLDLLRSGVIRTADDPCNCFSYQGGGYPLDFDLRPVLDFVANSVDADIERDLRRLTFPPQYVESTQPYSDYVIKEWSAPAEMVTPLIFAARGVAYIATVLGSNTVNKPQFRRVYLAAPARLEAMRPFLAAPALGQQKRLRTGYLALVESLRSLPATGFDFSVFKFGSGTHLLTRLSSALSGQSPSDAIATVMRLRNSDDGELLRQEWRKEIWSDSAASLIGHASQSVANCDVAGDIIQTIHVHSACRS
jgi:hypothetical protein